MNIQAIRNHKLRAFVAGIAPVVLAVVVAVLFITLAGVETRNKNQQRAADGVNNAAQSIQWMLEDGVKTLTDAAEIAAQQGADTDGLLLQLADMPKFANVAVAEGGVMRYPDGNMLDDLGYDKFPNCEIGGRRVNLSTNSQGGLQIRLSVNEKIDLVYRLGIAAIDDAAAGIFDGIYYYAVYNVRTGSYLYNNLPFESASYYDALLSVNQKGAGEALFADYRAQAYFKHLIGSENCIVAQQPMDVAPWGVALVLPEKIFAIENSAADYLYIAIGAAIFLQIALSALFILYVFRRFRRNERSISNMQDAAGRKLNLSVESTGVCVFEYNRGRGCIVDFHDGMADPGAENQLVPKTINEFISYYKPNDEDALHLYEVFAEIRAGETQKIDVHAFANEGERLLRFRLNCLESGSGAIIGSVRDCTQDEFSQTRIQDEERYLENMRPKSASIWEISVNRNSFRIIYDKRGNVLKGFGANVGEWLSYDNLNQEKLREYLHPADAEAFFDMLSVEKLMHMYHSGTAESVYECRVHSVRKGGYEWHRQMLRVYRDPDTKGVTARLYVLNVDAEKKAEMERRERHRIRKQALTAIGGIYYGLYYIELDSDLCYTAKSHAGDLGSDISASFGTAFAGYIDQFVHEEDRAALRRMLDPYMLRKSVTEEHHFQRCEFRARVGENYRWSAAIIQAARFENAQIRDVVLAFEDISDIKSI